MDKSYAHYLMRPEPQTDFIQCPPRSAQGTRRRRSERVEETRPARRRWGRETGDKKRRGEGKLGALCHHADAIGEWNLAFGGSGGAPPTKSY
jgi:hypothetical protein